MKRHIIALGPGLPYDISFDGQSLKINNGRKILIKGKVSILPWQRAFDQYLHTEGLLRQSKKEK